MEMEQEKAESLCVKDRVVKRGFRVANPPGKKCEKGKDRGQGGHAHLTHTLPVMFSDLIL